MRTQWTLRVRLCALATAGLALASVSTPVRADSRTDNRPVMALNGWNGRMGPGIGSTKAPFGISEVGTTSEASENALSFHTSGGQAVQQLPITRMGPGSWSVKSPTSGWYDSNVF